MKIVLASSSPRRKELLSKITTEFEIIPSNEEERPLSTNPTDVVQELAYVKAHSVYLQHPDALVIGCDTVVDLDGAILGKPHDDSHAKQMLNALSGRTHFVHTGVCIIYNGQTFKFCDSTSVTFKQLTNDQINHYVNSGLARDKAGAYGIQECGFVTSYDGSYDNVVGLPTERVKIILDTLMKG